MNDLGKPKVWRWQRNSGKQQPGIEVLYNLGSKTIKRNKDWKSNRLIQAETKTPLTVKTAFNSYLPRKAADSLPRLLWKQK